MKKPYQIESQRAVKRLEKWPRTKSGVQMCCRCRDGELAAPRVGN